MIYRLHLLPEAEDDIVHLYRYIAYYSSPRTAQQYIRRIRLFLDGLSHFPKRGTVRDEIEPGLRIVGFERRASIAFKVQDDGLSSPASSMPAASSPAPNNPPPSPVVFSGCAVIVGASDADLHLRSHGRHDGALRGQPGAG